MKIKQKREKYGTVRVKIWSTQNIAKYLQHFTLTISLQNIYRFFHRKLGTLYQNVLQQYE